MKGGIEDRLIIGYDSGGDNRSCLIVGRRQRRGIHIINQLYDEDAEKLYEQLTGEGK